LEHFLEKREAGLEDFKQFWTRVVDGEFHETLEIIVTDIC
jgi:hypothetical protein